MDAVPTPVHALARFASDLEYDALPAIVVDSIKLRMLDTIGVALAASPLETSTMALRLAEEWGGPSSASVIGTGAKFPAASAAFVNGVLAHSLDFDDTHLPSVLHPSATVIPTVLAVSEAIGASGKELITAAAAAYEVCVRVGMAGYNRELGNSVFFERGWHATSICGTLAASVAAARLYDLDSEGIGHALSIAASMASGIIEGNRTGGSVKRLHCGWAAHAGIMAAQAARAGFTGPATALEGRFGFFQAFCGGLPDPSALTAGLATEWSIPRIFYKPYPANHFTHAAIDAALKLRQRVQPEEIRDIEVRVASATLRTIAEPAAEKTAPRSGYQAQFSGPFVVATAFIGGGGLGVWLDDFTDVNVRDPRYLGLARRVRCIGDPVCDAIFPNQFPAIVTVTTHDGRSFREEVLANRGGPENPLGWHEIRSKFMANASRALQTDQGARLADRIMSVDERPLEDAAAAWCEEAARKAVGINP